MATKTVYVCDPSHVFVIAARERGAQVHCMWEMRGPPDTNVAWIACYMVNGHVALVETYFDPRTGRPEGWDVFTSCAWNEIAATIDDVLARCGVETAP